MANFRVIGLISASVQISSSFEFTHFCDGFGFVGEFHIPEYKFCGPGTKVLTKIHEEPIDDLDKACKEHDLVYCKTNDVKKHCKSDLEILKIAEARKIAKNASVKEKTASVLVIKAMKFYMTVRSFISSCECSVEKGGC